jgi:hypothetical protein
VRQTGKSVTEESSDGGDEKKAKRQNDWIKQMRTINLAVNRLNTIFRIDPKGRSRSVIATLFPMTARVAVLLSEVDPNLCRISSSALRR